MDLPLVDSAYWRGWGPSVVVNAMKLCSSSLSVLDWEVEQPSSATWACLPLSRWLLGSLVEFLWSLLGDLDLLEDLLAASLGGDGDPLLPDVDENGGGLYFSSVEALGQVRELCPKPLQFQQVIWVDGIRSFLGRPWKAAAAMCSFSSGEMVESDIWLET